MNTLPFGAAALDTAELRSLLDRAQDTLYRLDANGHILWANRAVEQLLGYTPEEVLGMPVAQLYADPEDREKFLATLESSGGTVFNYRARLLRKDGSPIWVSTNAHYVRDADDRVIGIEGVTRDITPQQLTEQALRESEQRFRTIAETSTGVVFVYRDKFLYANPGLERLTGYSAAELLTMPIESMVHPDQRDMVRQRAAARLRGEPVPTCYELKLLTREGEERWVEVAAGVIEYEGGPAGIATGINITERKRMETALRESEGKYRQLVELAQEGIWSIDENSVTSFVNPRMAEMLGYTVAEMTGHHLFDFMDAQGRAICERNIERRRQGIKEQHDFELLHRDGRRIYVSMDTAPIMDSDGVYRGAIAGVIDISQRREAEEALRTSESRLTRAQHTAHLGNWEWDIVNNELIWSGEVFRIFGLDPGQFNAVYEAFLERVHPDDRPLVESAVNDALDHNKHYAIDHRIVRPDGVERIVHEQAEIRRDADGRPLAMLGTVQDITDRKRVEKALGALASTEATGRESDFFQICVENLATAYGTQYAFIGVFADETKSSIRTLAVWAGDTQAENFEYELAGTPCQDILNCTHELVSSGAADRYPQDRLLRDMAVDSYYGTPLYAESGRVLGLVAVMDTSPMEEADWRRSVLGNFAKRIALELERHETRVALRESEERFSKVFSANAAMITLTRLSDSRFIDVNDSFLQASGYRRDEIIGHSALDLNIWASPDDRDRLLRAVRQRGSLRQAELPFRDRAGAIHHVLCSAELVTIDNEPCLLFIGQDIGDRKRTEEALKSSEQKYRALVDHARDAIFIAQDNVIKFPNPKTLEMFGYSAAELLQIPFTNMIAPEYRDMVIDRHRRRLGGENVPETYAFEIITRSGERRWIEINAMLMPWEQRPATLNVVRDVTAHKQAEDALFQEKERAQVTLQSIADGVITTDAGGMIEYLNPVAAQLTGWPNDRARGKPLMQIFNIIDEGTRKAVENPVNESLRDWCRIATPGHTALVRADGQEFAIEYSASPILDGSGATRGAVVVFRDVTEMRGLARQLSYQASHDALTGLINRREFENRLDYALESARTERKQHALCYLDLDQFKVVNDTCGHVAGDELLRQLAARLLTKVRDVDTLARLGGDEFGILLEGCPLNKARDIADQLRGLVKEFRFAWEDKTFEVGVSIGLVPLDRDTGTLSEVLSAADAACYVAKDLGRNRVHVYQPDDKELARRHGEMQWITRISDAIETDRFELYCQGITPLTLKAGTGVRGEILLRMREGNDQLVPPMAFIPAAERYNMMPALDRWVVAHLFQWLSTSAGERQRQIDCLAINLSGQSLSDEDFLDFVLDQLDHHAVDPTKLCFEITETAAIANATGAMHFIDQLKQRGCRFALDDFGSGLSSFAYLKSLKVDYLKIDGHFVRDIVDDPIDHAMVESINHIGHVMGLETIAEFVESERILEALEKLGVDYAQGFHVGSPRPLADVFRDDHDRGASTT